MKKHDLAIEAQPCPVWRKQVVFGADQTELIFAVPAYLIPLKGQAVLKAGNRHYRALPGRVLRLGKGLKLTVAVWSESFWYAVALAWGKTDCRTRLFTAAAQPELLRQTQQELSQACGTSACPACDGSNPRLAAAIWQALETDRFALLETLASPNLEPPLKLIHQRYREPLSLKELARPCQMSSSAFSYCFHKEMGIRPSDYLIRHRLTRACQKLRQGHTVAQAAYSAGYDDPFYFSRLFKRHFGVAPAVWKQRSPCG
ncbi:MAG: AraC family transcriptional regulator [Oscillospiraceae bacterium]|nr:AraC family transcriptional regulator [Oscillospiraceae bacterium]MDD4368977.1 AraC family transcriptional regulator [Oscillospiraceae bacterium]